MTEEKPKEHARKVLSYASISLDKMHEAGLQAVTIANGYEQAGALLSANNAMMVEQKGEQYLIATLSEPTPKDTQNNEA